MILMKISFASWTFPGIINSRTFTEILFVSIATQYSDIFWLHCEYTFLYIFLDFLRDIASTKIIIVYHSDVSAYLYRHTVCVQSDHVTLN